MKFVEGFVLKDLGTETVVVPEGKKLVNFNKMFSLNKTSAFLWESVAGKEFSVKDLSDLLVGQYDIDREIADNDAEQIVNTFRKYGLIED